MRKKTQNPYIVVNNGKLTIFGIGVIAERLETNEMRIRRLINGTHIYTTPNSIRLAKQLARKFPQVCTEKFHKKYGAFL